MITAPGAAPTAVAMPLTFKHPKTPYNALKTTKTAGRGRGVCP